MLRQLSQSVFIAVTAVGLLAGCGRDMDDLEQQVETMKARKGGRIDPLPQIKPYEGFTYGATAMRSPFVPEQTRRSVSQSSTTGIRPDATRNPEFLEGFPLDTLRMVGSLTLKGVDYALVQTSDGRIHRVRPGNHLGQNDGRILSISESEITLIEIVSDGLGGYVERPAAVALSE